MAKIIVADYIGKKYGRLTILSEAPPKKRSQIVFTVKCDCGNIKKVLHNRLVTGHTKSCGCYQKEVTSKLAKTHGLNNHPLYVVWSNIKKRCTNPKDPSYKNYGGRGINMDTIWINDFVAFYNWAIKKGWAKGLQIDRRENSGNYSPDNCRFVTRVVNNMNRRNTVYVTYKNERLPLAKVLEDIGLKAATYRDRIKHGWSIEKALSEPVIIVGKSCV